jgi:Ni,Fe-hydrogenase I cytochrome b subunit
MAIRRMTLRDLLSPNPRLTRQEYELAESMGRKRYAVRGALRMARWLLTLSVVILGVRGYLAGNWAMMFTPRVALEVAALVVLCSTFVSYTTYALIWKALHRMFGPKPAE